MHGACAENPSCKRKSISASRNTKIAWAGFETWRTVCMYGVSHLQTLCTVTLTRCPDVWGMTHHRSTFVDWRMKQRSLKWCLRRRGWRTVKPWRFASPHCTCFFVCSFLERQQALHTDARLCFSPSTGQAQTAGGGGSSNSSQGTCRVAG